MENEDSRDDKGRLLPGHGGLKKKGSNNRLQADIKEKIIHFIDGELDSIEAIYKEVLPKDKLKFIESLLAYVLPKSKEILIEEESTRPTMDFTSWPERDIKQLLRLLAKNGKEN